MNPDSPTAKFDGEWPDIDVNYDVEIRCPECGKLIGKGEYSESGQEFRCPKCFHIFAVKKAN